MDTLGTVFVVDDDAGVRESSRLLFESVGLPVRAFASGDEFLAAYRPGMTGCVVLDLRMPGIGGLELQDRLAALGSGLQIVFLTAYGDVPTALRALRHGAANFLPKPVRDQDLLDAVNRALRTELASRPHVEARSLLKERLATLSARETEVLDHVLAGRPTRIVAQALGISERTVEAHRARAFAKLQVRSVPQLIRALDELR